MTTSPAPLATIVEDRDVLEAARGYADQIADAELGLMIAALEWAHRNPSPELDERTAIVSINPDDEVVEWEKFAHGGCPVVEHMSIPEFAYAVAVGARGSGPRAGRQ